MNNKILIGSIIAVAILVLVSTSSAIDEKTDDIKVTSETDDYKEIITFINGAYTDFHVLSGFIIKDVNITALVGLDNIYISGWRWEECRIRPDMYWEYCKWVQVPRFIGYTYQKDGFNMVRGTAFGNIEYKSSSNPVP